jgi:hypothetical protein
VRPAAVRIDLTGGVSSPAIQIRCDYAKGSAAPVKYVDKVASAKKNAEKTTRTREEAIKRDRATKDAEKTSHVNKGRKKIAYVGKGRKRSAHTKDDTEKTVTNNCKVDSARSGGAR